jgi:hypothetical protein
MSVMSTSQHVLYEGSRLLMPSIRVRLEPLIRATTPPPIDGDPVKALAAKTLHSLLLGVLLWLVLFSAIDLPFFAVRKGTSSALAIITALSVLSSLFYLARSEVKFASWIFLSCMWFDATIFTMLSGGIESRTLLFYIPISIMAAWLLGQRAALISAGIFTGMSLLLALLGNSGVRMPKYFPLPPIVAWSIFLLFTAMAVLPANQVLRALGDALKQAQGRVEDLKHRELALRESEDRCRLAMENGRMFAFEWNPLTDEVWHSADALTSLV